MIEIAYDLTPYLANPYGGIARVSYNTYLQAVKSSVVKPVAFCNGKITFHSDTIQPVLKTAGKKIFGKTYPIAHSLNHRLLPVKAKKTVYTLHDVWSLSPNKYQAPEFQKKLAARITRDLQKADLIVTISETTQKNLLRLQLIPPEKCRFVHLGCEKLALSPLAVNSGIKDILPKKYVLFVGCIEVRKNIEHVLEAVKPFDDLMLVLAGSPGYGYERIAERIEQFPQERLYRFTHGSRNELAHLYANATALLLPSWEEGFGLPIVEAMSAGCPVITSNLSANAEIGGDGALLVSPEKPEESTEYIRRLLKDESFVSTRKRAGTKRATQFTWEKYFNQLSAFYTDLIS